VKPQWNVRWSRQCVTLFDLINLCLSKFLRWQCADRVMAVEMNLLGQLAAAILGPALARWRMG